MSSSKSNRLFLSACVSLMTLSFCMNNAAQAGFEWTPPASAPAETSEPEITPGSALPMPPPDVQEEILGTMPKKAPVMAQPIVPQQPAQHAKSGTPMMKTMSMDEQKPAAKVKHKKITPAAQAPAEMPIAAQPQPASAQAEQVPSAAKQDLAIDPYPTQAPRRKKPTQSPVVLPADSSKNMSEVALEQLNQKPDAPQGDEQSIKWNDGLTFAVAEGFGSDIPLALALSQIVPPDYAYSFGDGVNPGQRVSWNGGKPWNEVLSDVLAPLHIVSEIKGKTLQLKKLENQASASPAAIAEQPAAPAKKKLNLN
jgi:hypothetical protein